MSPALELNKLAKVHGIQTEFFDAGGERREASPEMLRAVLKALDVEAGSDSAIRAGIEQVRAARKARRIEPVIVAWNGRAKAVKFRGTCVEAHLELKGMGESARLDPRRAEDSPPYLVRSSSKDRSPACRALDQNDMSEESRRIVIKRGQGSAMTLVLPSLPFGYYDLRLNTGAETVRSLVISAPTKSYAPPAKSEWGVFLPLYAAHGKESWGAGNFSDWQTLGERVGELGGSVVATLPLLAAFLDDWKCEPSPYSPASRLFWNEFYLDVTRVPEFTACAAARRLVNSTPFQKQVARLRASPLVDYRTEMSLKRRVLEQLATLFFRRPSPRSAAFDQFARSHPQLERYAEFRATGERRKEPWQAWPARMRDGQLCAGDFAEDSSRYHMFVQWLAQEQMDALLAACRERGVKFYLDLPLGVHPDSYDVWRERDSFARGASVGAPPDAFFTKGQDWGFPPLHPRRVREDGYRYVIEYLRFQMRHTGLLRLDHVMGLHRLWWVPRGASAADGAYVSYNADELYAILSLESHRHQTALVGENLGTVPPEVNGKMKRHGIRKMFVLQYETQPDTKQVLRQPPGDCVASLNTHDMPMWAAHWKGLDIADRQKLGLMTHDEARAERKRRAHLRTRIVKFLRREKLLTGRPDARAVLPALFKFLGQSRAEMVLVNLEDLWFETQPQNTPGTCAERVNWRRKAKLPVERVAGVLQTFLQNTR
jgi:4-alpha-glucanotransferase